MSIKRVATALVENHEKHVESSTDAKGISRREFLNCLWAGSIATGLAAACGAAAWFASPPTRLGKEVFHVDLAIIPPPNADPVGFPLAKCWLINTDRGLLALFMECTRDKTMYKWVEFNNRFECPRCGSKFQADGTKLSGEGPAPRNLDRFVIQVNTPHGIRITPPDGSPVSIVDATEILINTRYKWLGKPSY
jgi:hypothetical protein